MSEKDEVRKRGEHHHNAKLTDHEVDLLVELHDEGMSMRQLSVKFEVSLGCVCDLVNGNYRARRA